MIALSVFCACTLGAMALAVTMLGAIAALIWAYLLFARGMFWRTRPAVGTPEHAHRRVVAVMPARNESVTVGRAVLSLLTTAAVTHVVLVDDGSTDGTADVARSAADSASAGGRLTILQAAPLPPGWSGKLWALEHGIARARAMTPDYLLLTDADVVHAAQTVDTLIAIAEGGRYDLASLMVKLQCRTVSEKLLIPAFVYFFFMLYPPRWTADPQRQTAGAAGGCILIRPQALERCGGVKAIRHEIIDDCALARRVKESGGRVWLGMSSDSASLRQYDTFAEIAKMISRTAFSQLRHSVLLLTTTIIGLAIMFIATIALLFSGVRMAIVLGALAWAMMTVSYVPMVRCYGGNLIWAVTLPAAAVFYMGATLTSAVKYWCGRGGEWKGRVQDQAGGLHSEGDAATQSQ